MEQLSGLSEEDAALIAAWETCGRQTDLANRISPPASMSFSGLSRFFGSPIAP